MEMKDMKWFLLVIAALILFSGQGTLSKEAVADVNGQSCTEDADCPCWGEYMESGITAYGLGVSNCIDCSLAGNLNATACQTGHPMVCDTTYCFDVQPVGEWARDNPWQWLKDNPMWTVAIVGLILMFIVWPKR